MALLEVDNLSIHFPGRTGINRAVDGVSFSVQERETIAIVGESGSGKSVTANTVMRLLPSAAARISGMAKFQGKDLLTLSERDMRKIRGKRISMVFQEPMTSLNPVMAIGTQIAETLRLHDGLNKKEARNRAIELLGMVGIPEPQTRLKQLPQQLSGGMRQRVMIAIALACSPELLIADEPTTALDVTIQAQILDLLNELQQRVGASIILITHDLGVVYEVATRVIVMYAGRIVEESSAADLFAVPRHPYTQGLIAAMPRLGSSLGAASGGRLREIPGTVPRLDRPLRGCSFAQRCQAATYLCRSETPIMELKAPHHLVACHHVSREPNI